MAGNATPGIERVVASALYLPLGVGAKIVEDLPTIVDKARQQITVARFLGKMVVDHGAREMKGRVSVLLGGPESVEAETAPTRRNDSQPEASSSKQDKEGAEAEVPSEVPAGGAALQPVDLALPDYDQLPAAHVVRKLAGLTEEERTRIEAYETVHRHRRTVLGKLEQLRLAG